MNCLKCGKDIPLGHVFCDNCQQSMDNYPIDPGIPVVIHPRPDNRPEQRRKRGGYADKMRTYQKWIRWLSVALAASLLACGILALCLYYTLNKQDDTNIIGQNYTTVETGDPS